MLTSNQMIDRMARTRAAIVETHTRKGTIYHFSDELRPLPKDKVARLIRKKIVELQGDGLLAETAQTYRLSEAWGG